MSNLIKVKRGTLTQLNTAGTNNLLVEGEPYLITDQGRLAIGLTSATYAAFAKTTEVQPLDADLTAISALTGTSGFLKKTAENTWTLDTATYLTEETDTLTTVLARGATTTTAPSFFGGITINQVGSTNGATFAGSTSGTAKLVAAAEAGTNTVITLPTTTGTLALAADIPVVNNGALGVSIGAAAASGTALAWGTSTGFTANASEASTYDLRVGPSISALATLMSTAGAGFIRRGATADTYTVDTNTYLTGNESITVSGDATGSGTTSIALTLANTGTAGTYTKVTTDAKGRVTSGTTLTAGDIPTLTADKISDFDTQVRTNRLDQMSAPTAAVSLNGQLISGLADPVSGQDAATKNYVDSAVQGLSPKDSVRAATTGNITLSGLQTVDGVEVQAGDRVLVKSQSTGSQNGIYLAALGAWSRTSDADTWNELISAYIFVEDGTINADNGYLITVNAGGTLGVTDVTVVQFSGAGQISAGNGLTKTGNVLDVVGTTDRIVANADNIDIASTYVGQTSITTLGTITTGTWNGTTISVGYGGTGLTSAVTGLLKGNGTSYAAAVAGTDYISPDSTIDGGTF